MGQGDSFGSCSLEGGPVGCARRHGSGSSLEEQVCWGESFRGLETEP